MHRLCSEISKENTKLDPDERTQRPASIFICEHTINTY